MPLTIESTNQVFSALGGLPIFDQILDSLNLRRKLKSCLPQGEVKQRIATYDKFRSLVLGLIAGAECLDDMEKMSEDKVFQEVCGDVAAPITYGRFLRDFDKPTIRKLNNLLIEASMKLRFSLFKDNPLFILDLDSTTHLQYGKKMEGLGYNYAAVRLSKPIYEEVQNWKSTIHHQLVFQKFGLGETT